MDAAADRTGPFGLPAKALEGRTALVTGATSGIGRVAAKALAGLGAELFLVARSRERGEATLAEIRERAGSERVSLLYGDLASQRAVREVAERFLAAERPLHLLVNNAGVLMRRRRETEDGVETTLAVNHLAPFLLTSLLMERLRESAPARVVTVASGAHRWAEDGLDFDDFEGRAHYRPMQQYGRSKLANILFTRELARRLEGSGVTANALHPGFVGTRFAMNNGLLATVAMTLVRPFARTPEQGADTLVYLCAAPELEGVTGRYYVDRRERHPAKNARRDEDARRLWEWSAERAGLADA